MEGGDDSVPLDDQSLISLQNLQTRVKAVGKLMQETTKPALQRRSISKTRHESLIAEIDELKARPGLGKEKHERNRRKGHANELMKDIPLDHQVSSSMQKKRNVGPDDLMLELWESAENGGRDLTIYDHIPPSTDSDMERELAVDKLEWSNRITFNEPNQDVLNDTKILERLDKDAEKLELLQTTVDHLRWKIETNKKGKKFKNVEFEAAKQQLQEADDTIVSLFDLNGQLVKNIEHCPPDEVSSPKLKQTVKTWRIKVMEQTQKGSERIERLELSVQKIQTLVSRFDDDSKNKGRNKFLKSRTIILRDFVDNGKKNSGIRKKGPRCGCFRQSASGNEIEAVHK